MIKCFFFDRDGVLIKNYGFVHKIKNLKWLKGVKESIKFLNKKRIMVIVITNQSGIARGYFTEKDLNVFHSDMNLQLKKLNAFINKFYYCPFHPEGVIKKYSRQSNLRKPGNGMLIKALRDFKLKPNECFMIGDQKTDYVSAKKTNVRFQYKKNYSLKLQIKQILKQENNGR